MDRIAKLKEYLSRQPDDNFLQHALALEYIKLGNEAEAARLFTGILSRDPGYIGSYYHLGKLQERTGDTDAAVRTYEKGMEEARKVGDSHALGELRGAWEELTL